MSDASSAARSLRERLSGSTEDRLGRAFSDLLENPLLTGAIGRAFDAREKAVQAQELAMGALNIPSAADIERLTRRLRSVSSRLEGIEDGVDRLEGVVSSAAARRPDPDVDVDGRLAAIEAQLKQLNARLDRVGAKAAPRAAKPKARKAPPARRTTGRGKA